MRACLTRECGLRRGTGEEEGVLLGVDAADSAARGNAELAHGDLETKVEDGDLAVVGSGLQGWSGSEMG